MHLGLKPSEYSSMGEELKINTRKRSYLIILIIQGVITVRGSIISGGLMLYSHHRVFNNVFQHFLNNISFYGYQNIVWTNYTCENNQKILTTIKTCTHCLLHIIKIASNYNHRTAIERKLLISFFLSSFEHEMIILSSMYILN